MDTLMVLPPLDYFSGWIARIRCPVGGDDLLRAIKSKGCWPNITTQDTKRIVYGVAAVAGVVVVAPHVKRAVARSYRKFASWALDKTKTELNHKVRYRFINNFTFKPGKPRECHSHPVSASLRTTADYAIDSFIIRDLGLNPYSVSTSARDTRLGSRMYYHAKDLDLPYLNDTIDEKVALKMVDVDYYVDMADYLWYERPILLYTFVPNAPGGALKEGVFSIKDDVVTARYCGGGQYSHMLWDYSSDHIIVEGCFTSLLVKVDSLAVPEDESRRVVCLTPTVRFWNIFRGVLGDYPVLKRRRFTYGEANVVSYMKVEGDKTVPTVAFSPVGSTETVALPVSILEPILIRLGVTQQPSIGEVERMLKFHKVDVDGKPVSVVSDASSAAALIYQAHVGKWKLGLSVDDMMPDTGRTKPKRSTWAYQAASPLVFEDGKIGGVQIADPVVEGAGFMPNSSYNNDAWTISGRIKAVKNDVSPPGYMHAWCDDFITSFDIGVLAPWGIDEVIMHMDKPIQRARSEKAKHWLFRPGFSVRSFMKKEAYGSVTHPRNISTVPTDHTLRLNAYMLAAKEHIRVNYNWFVPGNTPREIVDKVREMAMGESELLTGDFSRMDGSMSEFLRKMAGGVILRLFGNEYRNELVELLDRECQAPAVTSEGIPYNTGFSTISGSPFTTLINTLASVFIVYCAARKSNLVRKSIGDIPVLAAGDDIVTRSLDKKVVEFVAHKLGMKLEMTQVKHGDHLTFLSRVFIDPWTSDSTIQEPKRALGKMHLSAVKNVPLNVVAYNKGNGYLATDALTPIISEYCKYLTDVVGKNTSDKQLQRYHDILKNDLPYWSQSGAWPQYEYDRELMLTVTARCLDRTPEEIEVLIEGIKQCNWEPIKYVDVKVVIPAIVNGDLLQPPAEPTVEGDRHRNNRRTTRRENVSV